MKLIAAAIKRCLKKIMPSQGFYAAASPACPCGRWTCSVKERVSTCFRSSAGGPRSCLRGHFMMLTTKCQEKDFQLDYLEQAFQAEKERTRDLQAAFHAEKERTRKLEEQVEQLTLERATLALQNMQLYDRVEILLAVQSSSPEGTAVMSDVTSL